MGKTITITCPEFKSALDEVNKYIAEQMGYTYKPKRERSPQEKGKRDVHWKHWQTELKWMNRDWDYVIELTPTDGVSVGGYCLFNLKVTDKSTGISEEYKDLHPVQAHNRLSEYQRQAIVARNKKRA